VPTEFGNLAILRHVAVSACCATVAGPARDISRGWLEKSGSNRVYVTHLDHPTADEAFERVFERFNDSLPRDCRLITIKINLCDYRKAESGATTDPFLLGALIRRLKVLHPRAEIYVLENDATSVGVESLLSLLGIREVAEIRSGTRSTGNERCFSVALPDREQNRGRWYTKCAEEPTSE